MISTEFAFLAIGLALGIAGGAALVIALRRRRPAREVRVTVSHDAVPRRGATLSSDAFVTAPSEPARGGPADRRATDRSSGPAGVMGSRQSTPASRSVVPGPTMPKPSFQGLRGRTSVSFGETARAQAGIAIQPERDAALDHLRARAASPDAQMLQVDLPVATATMDRSAPEPVVSSFGPASSPALHMAQIGVEPDLEAPALTRILRGDDKALFAVAALLGGEEAQERRSWEVAIRSIADALVVRAINEGWLDFPVGNPFWDTFTVVQCREIAGALAAAGHHFDGVEGWVEGHIPTYRDLTIAVAAAGLEPRRIRAWPTHDDIAGLYRDVTAAADDYVAAHARNLDLEELHELVGFGDIDRARVWANWDRVRTVLTSMVPAV